MDGEEGKGDKRYITDGNHSISSTASSTLCVRWEGVDDVVRVCEGVREAYITFPRWKSFSTSAVCTCMKTKKVNSIPSESWLDRVGERKTEVELICMCVGVPGFEGV